MVECPGFGVEVCVEIGAIDPADDAEHALIEKFAQCQIHILPNIFCRCW